MNGATLRDQGHLQAELAADPRVILEIDAQIARLNSTGWEWTADDLRKHIPSLHQPLIGARVRAAGLRKPQEQIHTGKTVRSTHPASRRARIAVWRGAPRVVWRGVVDEMEAAS